MVSNMPLFYVMGSSLVILLSGGILVGFLIRRKYRREAMEFNSKKPPLYDINALDRDFIPLQDIKTHSSTTLANPEPYKTTPISPAVLAPAQPVHTSPTNSFFEGGEGYYITPPSKNNNFLKQELMLPPPKAHVAKEDPSVPTTPTAGTEADPYGRGVVYLDGLLESKKWKLKDFKVDNESFHRPKKSNVWRTSYNVW